jgi:hypothetical protein
MQPPEQAPQIQEVPQISPQPPDPLKGRRYRTLKDAMEAFPFENPSAKPDDDDYGVLSQGYLRVTPPYELPKPNTELPGALKPLSFTIPKRVRESMFKTANEGFRVKAPVGATRDALMGKPGEPLRPKFARRPLEVGNRLATNPNSGLFARTIGASVLDMVGIVAQVPGVPLAAVRKIGRRRKKQQSS